MSSLDPKRIIYLTRKTEDAPIVVSVNTVPEGNQIEVSAFVDHSDFDQLKTKFSSFILGIVKQNQILIEASNKVVGESTAEKHILDMMNNIIKYNAALLEEATGIPADNSKPS